MTPKTTNVLHGCPNHCSIKSMITKKTRCLPLIAMPTTLYLRSRTKKKRKRKRRFHLNSTQGIPHRLHFFSINFFLFFLPSPRPPFRFIISDNVRPRRPPRHNLITLHHHVITYATPFLTTAKRSPLITNPRARRNICSLLTSLSPLIHSLSVFVL